MKEIKGKDENQNDWAKNIKGEYVHISTVEKGLKGYYCLGCDMEMQAVKGNVNKHYFRHHTRNKLTNEIKCAKANREYRELLARSILNRLKYIKVPKLFKYPPLGCSGGANLIEKEKTITASYTKSELTFYENEEGEVNWGENRDIEDRYLLIRPDVTFFDKNDKPILFIEFVITHKVPFEKIVKLNRLGINTVQIIIPKASEEEIEKSLKSSQKYKWVYNEVEANTKYVSVPEGNSETILSIDEEQRRIFEKSFACKSSEINELIRSIKMCLRGEQYRGVKQLFEHEISRVEKNRERFSERLGVLEERCRNEALARNRDEEKSVENRYNDLERRYFKKRSEIERAKAEAEKEYKTVCSDRKVNEDFSRKIERVREIRIKLQAEIEERSSRVEQEVWEDFRGQIEFEEAEIERIRKSEGFIEKTIRETVDRNYQEEEREIEVVERRRREAKEEIWENHREQIEFEEAEIRRIELEETELQRIVREQFNEEVRGNSSKLTKRIRTLLEARRVLDNFIDAKRQEERYTRARELLNKNFS